MSDVVPPEQAAVPTTGTIRRRKPWVAAILSVLVVPGLGHLYAGFHRRAVLLFLLFPPAGVAVLMLIILIRVPLVNVAIAMALFLALYVLVAYAAANDTRKMTATARVHWFSRWYSLLAAVVLVSAVIRPAWVYVFRTTLVEAYKVPSGGMENTILIGDHLLAVKWAYGWRLPLFEDVVFGARPAERGDLVVFPFPEDPSRPFIKRVIGLPRETVEIRDKVVYINGKPLDEAYVRFLEPPVRRDDPEYGLRGESIRDNWGPKVIPEGQLFVLGDNRDNSRDSRFWGFLRQDSLLGRAEVVYWSYEATKDEYKVTGWTEWMRNTFPVFRTRWRRLGRRLE